MSTLALLFSFLPIVTLSLFQYTQQECDYITITGVYASSSQANTLLIETRNDRTDNVFTTRACMPNPTWKIYDTRLTTNIKFYGEQSAAFPSNPQCLIDQTYEIPKATTSISTVADGDFVALRLELWVNDTPNPPEIACSYEWSGLIRPQNICDNVQFNGLYFMDGVNTADTIMMDISAPWNQYTCSYFAYPTFKIYNNINNNLWGKMDRMAQTYCLTSGEYPIINNRTRGNGLRAARQVSITIELWNNWREFACSWDWNGIITYGSLASGPRIITGRTLLSGWKDEDPTLSFGDESGRYIVYHVGFMVSLLLLI